MPQSLNVSQRSAPRLKYQLCAAGIMASALFFTACSSDAADSKSSAPATSSSSTVSASMSASAQSTAGGSSTATPTAAAAVKEIVAGFPSKLIPLIKGGEVQASSIQRSTPLSVASLTASVTAKPADVLAYYTKVFTDQGFKAQPGSSVEGVPLKTFVRANGQEIVTVSVVQTAQTSTVTIGANVLPASLK